MRHDPVRAANFLAVYDEAVRTARNLATSLARVSVLLPMDGNRMDGLSDDDRERLDAFRVRFMELQDILGAKVFRALLHLEEEKTGSQLDTLNAMEKRGIVPSVADWVALRRLCNGLSHEYPATSTERAAALNEARLHASRLLSVLDAVRSYGAAHLALDPPAWK